MGVGARCERDGQPAQREGEGRDDDDAGQWWSEGGMKPSEERVELDLRRGLLTRTLVLTEADEDPGADQPPRSLEITQRRLVSLRYRHLGAQETRIVSRGFSGRLHVRTGVDPAVTNSGVAEYRELNAHHLALLESTTLPDEHERTAD